MASNKIIRMGPVALGSSAANIVNPPTLTGGTGLAGTNSNTYIIITHIRLVNKTSAAATASLYIGASGASAAGTEVAFNNVSIPAYGWADDFGRIRLDASEYLTGLASAGATITFQAEGELGIV